MDEIDITACICTCNRYELLEGALRNLDNQTVTPSRLQILVVDTTDTAFRRHDIEATQSTQAYQYIFAGSVGLSAARNIALERCETSIIGYLDDDARADPTWVEKILDAFDRNPDAAAVGGPVLPAWESPPPHWLPDSMYSYLSILDLGDIERDLTQDEWLCGANLAFRVTDARAMSGFRQDLGRYPGTLLSNEELDFCQRLMSTGRRVLYSPSPRVQHIIHRERCSQDWIRKRVAWQALSDLLLNTEVRVRSQELIDAMCYFFSNDCARLRTESSLFVDVENRVAFERQCNLIRTRMAKLENTHQDPIELLVDD